MKQRKENETAFLPYKTIERWLTLALSDMERAIESLEISLETIEGDDLRAVTKARLKELKQDKKLLERAIEYGFELQ